MKKIVCLYGGPGSGKSTIAAGLFFKLKQENFNCELNREYVKEWVWEGRKIKPGDQTYYFAKQSRKERLYMERKLDFIITDSPLILTHFYGLKYDYFEQTQNTSLIMLAHHHKVCQYYGYKIEHFFLSRSKAFNPEGRNETEEEAKNCDVQIETLLKEKQIKYTNINTSIPELAIQKIIMSLKGLN